MNQIDSSFHAYLKAELPSSELNYKFERLEVNGENDAGLLFADMPFQNGPDSKSAQWTSFVQALEPQDADLTPLIDVTRLVFEVDPSSFMEHFTAIENSYLQTLGISIYKYNAFPNHCIFFSTENMLVQPSKAIVYPDSKTTDDTNARYYILSLNQQVPDFVRIFSSSHIIHFACSKEGLLVHHSALPNVPSLSEKQYQCVPAHPLFQSLIQYAFQVRYHSFHAHASESISKSDFLSQVTQPIQRPECPTIYTTILNTLFEKTYRTLENSIPSINVKDENAIISWLKQRDELESLYYLIGQNSPDYQQRIFELDQRFPTFAFAHILPDSEQLANAWFTDPSNWWGQSAAMGQLLNQHN